MMVIQILLHIAIFWAICFSIVLAVLELVVNHRKMIPGIYSHINLMNVALVVATVCTCSGLVFWGLTSLTS